MRGSKCKKIRKCIYDSKEDMKTRTYTVNTQTKEIHADTKRQGYQQLKVETWRKPLC